MSIIQGTSKAAGGGYEIDQSIRFNAADSAYLEKTYGSSESTLTAWSFSAWVKRSKLGAEQWLFAAGTASSNLEYLRFTSGDKLEYKLLRSGSLDSNYITSQLFRDPSAWMHIYAYRSSTTFKLYINGSEVADFSTSNAPGSSDGQFGKNHRHRIGTAYATPSNFLGAYLAEINFVPGTAKAVTDFGETNDDGVWVPIAYTGSATGNSFYITGEDSADLGADYSGNSNDFTSSGGLATTDQMSDTPTLNWCTLNPNDKHGSGLTLSDGNLRAVPSASAYGNEHGTFYVNSGKWVFEVKHTTVFGEGGGWSPMGERIAGSAHRGYFMFADGRAYINTSNQGTKGASLASGDYRYIFYDADLGAMWFAHVDVSSSNALVYDNSATKAEIEAGTTTNAVFTSIQDVDFAPGLWMDTSGVIEVNFGQSAFITSSDLPTGFNTLNTASLPAPSITDGSNYFNPVLFTGNSGTAFSVTGVGFQPDFVWGKPRSYADNHRLMDVVRGSTKQLITNVANAEFTQTQGITSFDSDGFTVGTHNGLNTGTNTYVAWNWLADNTTGSSNTDGSITSTVSANTTSGFSISTYTGNATVGATVGHGLGIAPKVVIVKSRSNAESWVFGHDSVGWTKAMYMQTTGAPYTLDIYWNNTAPTSSVVELHDHVVTNGSGATYVMYSFAEIPGYSSFGIYTGNGSTDGPFVWTGFTPRYVLFKRTNAAESWTILDTARGSALFGSLAGSGGDNPTAGNEMNANIRANTSAAEEDNVGGSRKASYLSNGFKVRNTNTAMNASGSTYIYMAFAEHPFGGDGAAPATAR